MLALGKRRTEPIELGLGEVLVQVTPKGFDGDFHLRNAQEAALHDLALDIREVGMKMLHIGSEFDFTVHPEGFVHLIHEIHRFGILERLEIDAFIKNAHEKLSVIYAQRYIISDNSPRAFCLIFQPREKEWKNFGRTRCK